MAIDLETLEAALAALAERVEDGGKLVGYRITGSKQWISNGGVRTRPRYVRARTHLRGHSRCPDPIRSRSPREICA
jgi:alkylation response protein AidB-like acyl-CoA dehydrogenase